MPQQFNNNREKLVFPYEIQDVDEKTNEKLLRDFTGERTGFVQVGPKKYFFPCKYRQFAQDIYNFQPRSDDVWIVTFPRSGTTWTQEMVWLLANNLDYETAAKMSLMERVPFFEYSLFMHKDVKQELLNLNKDSIENQAVIKGIDMKMWEELTKCSSRRFFKTHLPFSLLPPSLLTAGCKIIYVARNPKDVAVSFYHLNRLMVTQGYSKDFKTYFDYFTSNLQPWTPYWEHIKEGYNLRDHNNVLFMFYEEMTQDVKGTLKKLANFLNVQPNEAEFDKLEDHLSIEKFKKNPSVNSNVLDEAGVQVKGEAGFIRDGKVGGKDQYFDAELTEKFHQWIRENEHITADIKFPTKYSS